MKQVTSAVTNRALVPALAAVAVPNVGATTITDSTALATSCVAGDDFGRRTCILLFDRGFILHKTLCLRTPHPTAKQLGTSRVTERQHQHRDC
jgi:hypothetical protein